MYYCVSWFIDFFAQCARYTSVTPCHVSSLRQSFHTTNVIHYPFYNATTRKFFDQLDTILINCRLDNLQYDHVFWYCRPTLSMNTASVPYVYSLCYCLCQQMWLHITFTTKPKCWIRPVKCHHAIILFKMFHFRLINGFYRPSCVWCAVALEPRTELGRLPNFRIDTRTCQWIIKYHLVLNVLCMT